MKEICSSSSTNVAPLGWRHRNFRLPFLVEAMFPQQSNALSKDSFFSPTEHSDLRVIFGSGSLDLIGAEAKLLGKKVLLVTDKGIVAAGHVDRALDSLKKAGLEVTVFDESIENPTSSSINKCRDVAHSFATDLLIGFGGGSSMDTAKGCNFVLTNGGQMKDYWGVGKATRDMLPFIAVPTTAGTGSECQSFALISDDSTHRKMACGDPKALAKVALLDPSLTVSQPLSVTACTGIDAFAHALESAVTSKRNEFSARHSRLAFTLLAENLQRVLLDPHDLNARGAVLLGASHAGAAIEQSMLGAAHSMANPLTANRDVVHGQAVGVCLPAVIRFNSNSSDILEIYADLSRVAGFVSQDAKAESALNGLLAVVEELLTLSGFPMNLEQHGFTVDDIPQLAKEASEQWTAGFNPRSLTIEDFEKLYASLFAGTACAEVAIESSSN